MIFQGISSRSLIVLGIVLVAFTAILYGQTSSFQFVNYDDTNYVTQNPYIINGLSWQGIRWAFALPELSRNIDYSPFWRPVTYLSHMLDVEVFGLNPGGHHTTSWVLHIFNALLLFLILTRATKEIIPSVIVAALVAFHPVQVESVVWISARNTLVSMFFALLTLWFYLDYVEKRSKVFYGVALMFYALCLLSKATLVGLPFLLLLLDFWPLGRASLNRASKHTWGKLLIEKWPFLIFSVIATFIAIKTVPLALKVDWQWTPAHRVINFLAAYAFYFSKVLLPVDLTPYYPDWGRLPVAALGLTVAAGCVLLAAGTVFSIRFRRRLPFLFVGWFWYLIALLPASSLTEPADRYMYEPIIGVAILLVWGAWTVLPEVKRTGSGVRILVLSILLTLAMQSYFQAKHWADSVTLYKRVLQLYPENFVAHINMGNALGREQKWDEALSHFAAAIKISPQKPEAYEGIANVLYLKGNHLLAEKAFQQAVALNPGSANAWRMLGSFAQLRGDTDQALQFYLKSLAIREDNALIHTDLAFFYQKTGEKEEAIRHAIQSLNYDPNNLMVRHLLEELLAGRGGGEQGGSKKT